MSKILLICDENAIAKNIAGKLVFLRFDDKIVISDYKSALGNIDDTDIVLVCQKEFGTYELIEELRKNKNLCIMLLASSYNSDFILGAYDRGIDDFALISADDFELVIRIVNNIKHNSVKYDKFRHVKLLEQLKVIDESFGIYNYEYAKQVFENKFDENLYPKILMVISPNEASKVKFSMEKFSKAVKQSLRVDDITVLGRGAQIYILLSNIDYNGAIVTLNKIKENYGEDLEICSGIAQVFCDDFRKVEEKVLQALADAIATDAEYVFAKEEEETLEEWLNEELCEKKNYKIFRHIFNKKLEKVISPVFYRLQKAWEEKLFASEIEQYVTDEQCVFQLKNKTQKSVLKIIYPGFAKIIVSIVHEGLDSPENSEIQIPLNQISQKELTNIVENFIKEFKNTVI